MKLTLIIAFVCHCILTHRGGEVFATEFSQKDYHIINDRLMVDKQAEDWVHVNVVNAKFNRTHRMFSLNFNLHKDLHPSKFIIKVQAYRFISNVYKLFAPLKLSINGCEVLAKNSFGIKAWETTNGNVTDCPIKKGVMSVWNWVPEEDKFPPYVPEGKYRVALEFMSDATSLASLSWYGAVEKRRQF